MKTVKAKDVVSIHMCGKAEQWFNARKNVSWETFVLDVCVSLKDQLGENVVEQFNKLCETESLEDYLDSFEH